MKPKPWFCYWKSSGIPFLIFPCHWRGWLFTLLGFTVELAALITVDTYNMTHRPVPPAVVFVIVLMPFFVIGARHSEDRTPAK